MHSSCSRPQFVTRFTYAIVYLVDSVGDASNGSVVKSTSTEQVLLYIAMVNRELVDGIINFVTRNCGFGWINNSTTKEGLITK